MYFSKPRIKNLNSEFSAKYLKDYSLKQFFLKGEKIYASVLTRNLTFVHTTMSHKKNL